MKKPSLWIFVVFALGSTALVAQQDASRPMSKFDRERAQTMLEMVASDVRKHYYDPGLHGVDWNAKVEEAKAKIAGETTLNMAFAHIAAVVDSLNDSHTFFMPPPRPYHAEFGWLVQMIGDRCYIVGVRPKSDAEAKGVKAGDELLGINGYRPGRGNLWKMEFAFGTLRPQTGFRLRLRTPAGEEQNLDVATVFRQNAHLTDLTDLNVWQNMELGSEEEDRMLAPRFADVSPGVVAIKFDSFFLEEEQIEKIVTRAQKAGSLVFDLRGNPGGAVETAKGLLAAMFDHEIKIADRVTRNGNKMLTAKVGFGRHHFDGKLVVLVDSKSSSASEIFARVIQLEKRGTVVGDRSSGLVMEAVPYVHQVGTDVVVPFAASITDANLIMSDGKSLEHVGVTPDELTLPTAADLANDRDPVLTRAVEMLGGKLTPEDAGKLFPYRWAELH